MRGRDVVAARPGRLAAVQGLLFLVWLGSLVRRDASLVDRFWGLLFVVLVWSYTLVGDGDPTRETLAVVLVTVWGLRLAGYLTWRNWGEGEDERYAEMRARAQGSFGVRSLVTVFMAQGLVAWVVALPLLAVAVDATPAAPTGLDGAAAGVVRRLRVRGGR